MLKARFVAGWVAGCLICFGGVAAAADPTASEMLAVRPHQEGVNVSTPAAQEVAACQVEGINANNVRGYLLRDPKGRPLRRVLDTNGDGRVDIWSFYLDGVEVYREKDTTFEGKANEFRWLNSGGMKCGIDLNKDGKIDTWKMISAEEVSQEVLQALIARDYPRFQALFVNGEEMAALGLPQQEVGRIQESFKNAAAKFQDAVTKLPNLNDKTHWLHLETPAPQCVLAEHAGSKYDLIKYGRATILCETNGKHDWIQSGEMMMVRTACWRIVDAPSVGEGSGSQDTASTDPVLQGALDQLRDLDSKAPKGLDVGGSTKEIVDYNLNRATLLESIYKKVKPEEREQWVRQIADCLGAAAQNSAEADTRGYERLVNLEKLLVAGAPGTQIAAYVTFREMAAENAVSLAKKGVDINKVQDQWLQRLAKFVETYPTAEDAPEALMQLGMVSEFVNKEVDAKKWYEMLTKQFRASPLAAKATGAMKRLDLEGKVLELAGPTMDGAATFNMSQLRGKMVIVYYWASWNKERTVGDFASLKLLLKTYASRGVELVCVNLDNTAAEATAFLQQSPSPSVQIFQPGGLESPQAIQYGVMVLPNLFLVDKDGKVASRTVQVGNLEEELKKRLN